jgi:hypothetical protein
MKNIKAVQIDSPGRRAAAYWFVDGLPEIAFGLTLLIFGIYGIAGIGLHRSSRWILCGYFVALGLFVAMLGNHRRIVEFFKARITYPRTGYARPPKDSPSAYYWGGKILTLGLGTAHRIDENVSSFRNHTVWMFIYASCIMFNLPVRWILSLWMLPLVMTLIATLIYFWNRDDVRRFSLSAVLPIAAGGFIATEFNLTSEARQFAPLAIGGAWLLVIGICALFGYLRAHPKLDAGKEGRS